MFHFLFILYFAFIQGQENYERMISEKVSYEYCNEVINNLTSIIDEAYVYSDFLKAPKQPDGYSNYIQKVDLIKELKNIGKNDRTFYGFYRDIKKILAKAKDGHLNFYAMNTPSAFLSGPPYFCIPFKYLTNENFDGENQSYDIFLTIEYIDGCEGYSNEMIEKIKTLEGKKIIKINNISPFEYLEEKAKIFYSFHSPQARYVNIITTIHNLPIQLFPFKKEELNINIEFEGTETLQIEYQFKELQFEDEEQQKYYMSKIRKMEKGYIPFLDLKELELKFKIKKRLLSSTDTINDKWDYMSGDETIKCKIDEINKYNVIYQNSFYPEPEDFQGYELVMDQCFEEFYSNDYKIIIIEDKNGGGYTSLCIPFYQYLAAKIPSSQYYASKKSETNLKDYFNNFQFLNPETCLPYTEKDNIMEGTEDKYSEEVTHKKSKIYEELDIYYKINMENNRKFLLSKGNHKKPTDIIVFTDGLSFSCASILITQLQSHGAAIILGYNGKPGINKKDFDASQSNSAVYTYPYTESVNNLYNLNYSISITCSESFDPNDKKSPKTPYEFLVNPVDEIVKIYQSYNDSIYDKFINEAKSIFEKYNKLGNDGGCNPMNKYLYYETSDCDSKLNIDKAHGGYLCGTDGKWNQSNCIAAYCDEGYILNNDRNKCIKNPCDEISIVEEIISNITNEKEFNIDPKTAYYFYIDENNFTSYYFLSEQENFMLYIYNKEKVYINNQTSLKNEDYIYINTYLNISKSAKLLIVNKDYYDKNYGKKNYNNYNYGKGLILSIFETSLFIIGLII